MPAIRAPRAPRAPTQAGHRPLSIVPTCLRGHARYWTRSVLRGIPTQERGNDPQLILPLEAVV